MAAISRHIRALHLSDNDGQEDQNLPFDETAWFARDDLRPFGLMCLRMGWRMATRPFSANRKRAPSPRLRYRAGRAASGTSQTSPARPGAPRPYKEKTPE